MGGRSVNITSGAFMDTLIILAVLGLDSGYTVKYTPPPSGVPSGVRPRELLQAEGYI